MDAEDPTCARLHLSGVAVPLATDEIPLAEAAFTAKHPLAPWLSQGGAHTGGLYYSLKLESLQFLDYYGGYANLTVADYLAYQPSAGAASHARRQLAAQGTIAEGAAADYAAAQRRPSMAAKETFCETVAQNEGCCPACGYEWDGAKCVTKEAPSTPYCKELTEPKHSGCCVFCGHVWSATQGRCVR